MFKPKKMKNFNIFFSLGLFLFILTACKKATNTCIDKSAPEAISNPQVENLPGAAKITYTLPGNSNLLYVKAEWQMKGVTVDTKTSFYQNSVMLEGFGDTLEHEVTLYAVSNCEVASSPVTVTVKPLRGPIWYVYNSLVVIPTFGGINVAYQNPFKANIVIDVLVKDSLGYWQHVDFHYSSQQQNNFNIRGFQQNPPGQPQLTYIFGLYVKDRWDNHTDTFITAPPVAQPIAPIYEELLDKTKFKDIRSTNYPVPQTQPLPASGLPMVNAVDYSSSYPEKNFFDGSVSSMFHTKQNYDQPVWVPIDLDQTGVSKFKFSRFKIWQRPGTYIFNHGNPHKWEIWGTNTPTVVSSWVKLGEWTMIKPSGFPLGVVSNEDNDVAVNGQEYDFPAGIPAVRYIGWKNIDCWSAIDGATGFFHLMEITLWGQKQ